MSLALCAGFAVGIARGQIAIGRPSPGKRRGQRFESAAPVTTLVAGVRRNDVRFVNPFVPRSMGFSETNDL